MKIDCNTVNNTRGDTRLATRTTGSEGQSCLRCGSPIGGRRRSGYCSDRCRMRARRAGYNQMQHDLIDRIKQSVRELEVALLGETRE